MLDDGVRFEPKTECNLNIETREVNVGATHSYTARTGDGGHGEIGPTHTRI